MAHSNQSRKRIRQNEKARLHNKALLTRMRTEVKRVLEAVEAGDKATAQKLLSSAMARVDKAAKSNIIHANTASRRKSMMMRAIDRIGA
jgi:small subunit ribosomal protein S20